MTEEQKKGEVSALTASMRVNCSATMMGSKDRKLKAGSSSSKPLSSCVAKGQPMCSPKETWKQTFSTPAGLPHVPAPLQTGSVQTAYLMDLFWTTHIQSLSCLHTIRIRFTLLSALEVGQQVASTALQVRARKMEVQVGEELV